jgi:membrane protease YdiL (CAAX protease family)
VRTGKLVGWIALVGSLAALNYASRFSSGKPPRDELYRYSSAVGALLLYAIVLSLVLLIARGMPRGQLGVREPVSWSRALLLALVLLIAILVVEAALEPVFHASREQGLEPPRWEPDRAVPFAFNAAVVVLVAPFVEELTFRGLGFALLEPYGPLIAIAGTSAAFAAAHGLVAGFFPLFVFGSAIAFLRFRTESIFPGMLLHACYNAAALAIVFAN